MGTRANVIIKDQHQSLFFYRHSDGYPECTGESLIRFVKQYGTMRDNPSQSAGWLILQGHAEYNKKIHMTPDETDSKGWKVGAYEPTNGLHSDVEYIYVIDLEARDLITLRPRDGFWDNPSLENCAEYHRIGFEVTS